MDKETREFLDRKFNTIDEKFESIDRRFNGIDQKFEENKRYFGVVAEGLRNEIQQVAEGVANVNEKLDREITGFREEMREGFNEIKSMIKFSYAELDQRIRMLESNFQTLKLRMDQIDAGRNYPPKG